MAAPTLWQGATYIMAYFAGMSGMMITAIMITVFTTDLLMKYLRIVLPYMEWITGLLLIFAGIYVMHYQMALF